VGYGKTQRDVLCIVESTAKREVFSIQVILLVGGGAVSWSRLVFEARR
jgi:hypothetical protein